MMSAALSAPAGGGGVGVVVERRYCPTILGRPQAGAILAAPMEVDSRRIMCMIVVLLLLLFPV